MSIFFSISLESIVKISSHICLWPFLLYDLKVLIKRKKLELNYEFISVILFWIFYWNYQEVFKCWIWKGSDPETFIFTFCHFKLFSNTPSFLFLLFRFFFLHENQPNSSNHIRVWLISYNWTRKSNHVIFLFIIVPFVWVWTKKTTKLLN